MTDLLRDPNVTRDPYDKLRSLVAADEDEGGNDPEKVTCPMCGRAVYAAPGVCPYDNADLSGAPDTDADTDDDVQGMPTPATIARSTDLEASAADRQTRNTVVNGRHVPTPPEPSYFARKFTQGQRDKAAKEGAAMSDGSFPIYNKDDLKSAINLARTPAHRAHIKKRARALNLADQLPAGWS